MYLDTIEIISPPKDCIAFDTSILVMQNFQSVNVFLNTQFLKLMRDSPRLYNSQQLISTFY